MQKNSTGTVIANILQTGAVVQVSPYGVHSVNEMVTIGAYPAGPVTIVGSGNSSVANAVLIVGFDHNEPPRQNVDVGTVDAVYSHLQAMRSLGRTEANANDVAKALGLSYAATMRAMETLKDKGVRRAK